MYEYIKSTTKYFSQGSECYLASMNYLEDSSDEVTFFLDPDIKDSLDHYCAGGEISQRSQG